MTWFLWLVLVAAALLTAAVGLTAVGAMQWAEATQKLAARLETGRPPPAHAPYDASEIERLPVPVQRYFCAVLTEGLPIVTAVTIQMAGTFNLSATGEPWRPFTSRQRVSRRCPSLLWDARIAMLPGLAARVVDSYTIGTGLLRATIQGLFTMADGAISLTLLFRFDDAGLIKSFRAEARGGMVGKRMVQAPWEGRFSNYQTRGGMSVPCAGEVARMRPQGRKTYFKGTVTQLNYEFAP